MPALFAPSFLEGRYAAGATGKSSLICASSRPLLRRFVATASTQDAVVDVAANLAGTRSLAGLIDASVREAANAGRVDLATAVDDALPSLRAADLSATVVTMQGPSRLVDYLITRCVEAVVHGSDLGVFT